MLPTIVIIKKQKPIMAACNQTDIPVLNIQEDPCIQGSLSTNCIFYGLAIAYLGTQDSTNFADTLGYIVAKLEAGNNLATDLEEINRAQSLLIEDLQNIVAESLVTLSEVQVLLDQCCPEPTTTSTTTAEPTTTTTSTTVSSVFVHFGPTSAFACDQNYYNMSVILDGGSTSICDTNNIYANFTPYGVANTTIYAKQSESSLVRAFFVDASGTFATQTGICASCPTTTTTTTLAPTTTTSTTIAPTTTTTSTTAPTTTTTTTVAVPGSYILGTTGISPWDIVLDSEGNVYTSNVSSKSVSKITPDGTSTILGTTGEIPRGITIDTQGNIYVINSGDNTVTKITPSGVSTILGSAGTGANDIAVDQQGNVYVNNNGPNTVTKITPQGVSTTFASVASNPQCITIDAQGNVYTASPNVVNKITPSGVSTILGNTLYHPLDIIVDDLGNVYVSTAGNQVVKITPSGVSTSLGYVGSSPYGIALDSSGNVYTSNALSDNVSKITPDGVITVIGTTGLGPMAIVVDPAGNVYTANYNSNNVTKIVQAPSIFNNYGFDNYVRAVENSSYNSIYVGGNFTEYGTSYVNRIIKLNEGGTQDTSFNPGSGFNGVVWEILEQPDKKILVVGEFTSYNTTPARGIIRLNPDGSRDTSFNYGTGFTGFTGATTNIARQSDGKLIVASQSTHYNGTPIKTIVRINPDGTLDNTFSLTVVPTAISQSIVPDEIVVDSDDKFFVCWNIGTGNDMTINGDITNRSIHKFNADGTTDTSFSVAPNASEPIRVYKLIIKPDGKILAAGQHRVKQYNSDGTVDNSFNIATLEIGMAMEIDSSNRILVGGLFNSVNGISGYKGIVRLNQDGTIDNTFVQGSGFNMPGIILTMEKTLDNKFYLGGNFSSYNGLTCYDLARFDSNGNINTINA